MKLKNAFTIGLLFVQLFLFAQLQSPNEFLPHKLGEQFTPHHLLIDYFQHASANSDLVTLQEYGTTYEGRPLMLAFVTSKNNHSNLEKIRKHNRSLAGLESSDWTPEQPISIIWMTYSVHGNEPSGSECSMQVLYDLINPQNTQTKYWLENTVVIIDPAANPDGYDRYTHWFRGVGNKNPNSAIKSREHLERWPSGRVNHYHFDLNRDWAWLSQKESQQRIKLYGQWLPHIHPDVHEQYPDNPYYFAPAAEPHHEMVTDWQMQFQTEIGKNHAHYFDKNGWLYFTREWFDLLYPSYGDTYPTFNGAIGMTYEQAGHGVGGVAVSTSNGDTLKLAERIEHHHTTSLSTIEMGSKNADRVVDNFKKYFNTRPDGKYNTFIIKNNPEDRAKIERFIQLMDQHEIRYNAAGRASSANGFDYKKGAKGRVSINADDLIITTNQPKGTLAYVLFEPEPFLSDSLTYDITAWSLPYAYGLETYATSQTIKTGSTFQLEKFNKKPAPDFIPYALISGWESVADGAFLAELLNAGLKVRTPADPMTLEGNTYDRGTFVLTRADNSNIKNWYKTAQEIANKHKQSFNAVRSGFSTNGLDLGSDRMRILSTPDIVVLYGEKVNNHSYGFVWHFLEQELNIGFTALSLSQLESGKFTGHKTLILPEGSYKLSDDLLKKISTWVAGGGKLIAIGNANSKLADKEGFDLKKPDASTSSSKVDSYKARQRSHISSGTPGAITKVSLDTTHPLSAGLGDTYYSLKTNSYKYPKLDKGWNVGTIQSKNGHYGFIGHELKNDLPNTLTFGVQDKGAGKIIYLLDDPLFRAFWYNGKLLFSNALFLN